MSDYHILSGDKNGNSFQVVMHLPFPNEDNAIGVNYRTALSEQRGSPYASVIPYGLAGEQTALDAGALLEHSINYNTNPSLTPAENRNILRAIWTDLQIEGALNSEMEAGEPNLIEEMQNRLKYWHYTDDVP